jgi:hypothetical protein
MRSRRQRRRFLPLPVFPFRISIPISSQLYDKHTRAMHFALPINRASFPPVGCESPSSREPSGEVSINVAPFPSPFGPVPASARTDFNSVYYDYIRRITIRLGVNAVSGEVMRLRRLSDKDDEGVSRTRCPTDGCLPNWQRQWKRLLWNGSSGAGRSIVSFSEAFALILTWWEFTFRIGDFSPWVERRVHAGDDT